MGWDQVVFRLASSKANTRSILLVWKTRRLRSLCLIQAVMILKIVFILLKMSLTLSALSSCYCVWQNCGATIN
jgi:hypothetical protein